MTASIVIAIAPESDLHSVALFAFAIAKIAVLIKLWKIWSDFFSAGSIIFHHNFSSMVPGW